VSNELQAAFLAWLFAAPFWLLFWAVWSGRLRWLNDNLFGPYATTLLPGTAAGATVAGSGFASHLDWLAASSLVFFVVGMVLWFVVAIWDPVWMQPAWFREELASGPDARGRGGEFVAAVARSAQAPEGFGPVRFERDAVLLTDDPDRPVSVTVRYGRLGRLFVFDGAVVFVQNEVETSLRGEFGPAVIERDQLRAVRVTVPERNLANIRRLAPGDIRGRRFGRVLQLEVDEGLVEFHLRGLDEAIAAIEASASPAAP
jgi:hypothetical protein